MTLLENTEKGLYCAAGDFYIDPWHPVDFAVISHAHSDHARPGSRYYLCAAPGRELLQERLGADAAIETIPYGKTLTRNGVQISLHPAGHILGSAQVRVESRGEIWVVSGDYKTEPEKTCAPFEAIRCHTFVTESTFGLPIYHWRPQSEIFAEINLWWRKNQSERRTSVIFAYSLGKSQRLLSGLDASLGPIFVHGSVARFLPLYAKAGIELPAITPVENTGAAGGRGLVIAPASTEGSPWLRKCCKRFMKRLSRATLCWCSWTRRGEYELIRILAQVSSASAEKSGPSNKNEKRKSNWASEDEFLFSLVRKLDCPVFLVLTKIDLFARTCFFR